MERAAIISLVSAFMDETTPEADSVNIISLVEPLIEAHMNYAALRLLEMLPVDMQEVFTPSSLRLSSFPDYIEVTCPADFIKLSRIQLKGWSRPINKLDIVGSNVSESQGFRYMKGTKIRPKAILVQKANDIFSIELRPNTSSTVTVFYYVKKQLPENITDNLIDPLVWMIAGRVYESISRGDLAKLSYDHITNFIQSNTNRS